MSLMFEPLRKYATFRGRARRKEYWLWQLFLVLLSIALAFWLVGTLGEVAPGATPEELSAQIAATPGAGLPATVIVLVSLGLFLPSLAVQIRRLHDSDKSGWWILLGLTGIGSLVLLIFYLLDGTAGPNRHGPDPKGRGGA